MSDDAWLLLGLLATAACVVIATSAAHSAHEDTLDRRAMWNGIMDELQRERDIAYALCLTDEERMRFHVEWLEASKPLQEEIIARHRKVWGIYT